MNKGLKLIPAEFTDKILRRSKRNTDLMNKGLKLEEG